MTNLFSFRFQYKPYSLQALPQLQAVIDTALATAEKNVTSDDTLYDMSLVCEPRK